MKKYGFTLSEILITLTILGIMAAIAAPSFTKAMPDKYKTRVLKNYNAISDLNTELLSNSNIYYRKDPSTASENDTNPNGTFKTDTQYGCNGLFCTEAPRIQLTDIPGDKTGLCKYPNLLLGSLLPTEFLTAHSNQQCDSNSADKTAYGFAPDGSYWEIFPLGNTASDGYRILIDLDNTSGSPNCFYNSTTCKNPDRFIFKVDVDGNVSAHSDDKLTEVYLNNMTRTDKKADFNEAAQ